MQDLTDISLTNRQRRHRLSINAGEAESWVIILAGAANALEAGHKEWLGQPVETTLRNIAKTIRAKIEAPPSWNGRPR